MNGLTPFTGGLLRWLGDQRCALVARYWGAHLSAALRRKARRPVKRHAR